jgi:hypothetical protein
VEGLRSSRQGADLPNGEGLRGLQMGRDLLHGAPVRLVLLFSHGRKGGTDPFGFFLLAVLGRKQPALSSPSVNATTPTLDFRTPTSERAQHDH